ncbi:MAG TPA: SGNH/GDSL hydrolase family protein [Polyangiaceae bacterium]|nr:SGNH/GDSL hydrolase family protein [Polyangiaceae bacterium]
MKRANEPKRLAAWLLLALACFFLWCCANTSTDPTGGETHFLRSCDASSAACGRGLACLCGVCTLSCDASSSCADYPTAQCLPPSSASACDAPTENRCDVPCGSDGECTTISAAHRCQQGRCRAVEAEPGVGGAAPNACEHGSVAANDVLVIGDAFFAGTHQITAYLEGLARAAGALASGDRYRDNSSRLDNALALGGPGLLHQYEAAAADEPVKVVIMNGGGADVLVGACDTPLSDCQVLLDSASAARALFSRFADDGVEHVVYAFYPDPVDATIRAKMDALRPMIQQACDESTVACHFLDLRSTFTDHYDSYIGVDGLDPTPAGSEATANAIWSVMQSSCIAQ